jgi:ElaB/YqjD/DUF883 family membrane-anchored ribosome-binding protein
MNKLADAHDPNIQWLRDRVDQGVADAKRALAKNDDPSGRLREIAVAIDDYVRDYPWLAVLTGVAVAGTVAYLAGAAAGKRRA